MTEFIEHEVKEICGSSSPAEVMLLVGSDTDRDELGSEIREIGGSIEEYVGRSTLLVSIPKQDVEQLCGIPSATSIELDANDVATQESGNFMHQTDSVM